uniref:(California timema) hypothetical protein n=1 Tax=Timema californicum TaxID=61474 RepID=A0A7R9P9E3_TIMCA|nr:unnamed protein product [Timema californicum]
MGWYLVLSVLVAAYVLDAGTPVDGDKLPGDKYTTKYDNIDVNAILKSERLLNNYVKCILKDERCTPDGNLLKESCFNASHTSASNAMAIKCFRESFQYLPRER